VDIDRLIQSLILYRSHIEQAISHLEAAGAVGARRGPGRPRKEKHDVQSLGAAAGSTQNSSLSPSGTHNRARVPKEPSSLQ